MHFSPKSRRGGCNGWFLDGRNEMRDDDDAYK